MPSIVDIISQTFGRLTVIGTGGRDRDGKTLWLCRCSCGGEALATAHNLRSGHTKSCGCWRRENGVIVSTRHGGSPRGAKARLYGIWAGMLNRCDNPKNQAYDRYGGNGVKPAEAWRDFVTFRVWALANGYQDDREIHRRNSAGDYEPGNCEWLPIPEHAHRHAPQPPRPVIRSDGKPFDSVKDAANETGTTTANIARAIRRGWSTGGYRWAYGARMAGGHQ
jgi:hypothetical protein